jgi:hypothetical protein
MNFTPAIAVVMSGVLWLIIGLFLLIKGLNLVMLAVHAEHFGVNSTLVPYFSSMLGGTERAALSLITVALVIGLLKGRLVLIKSVKRVVTRIYSLPLPLKINQIYSWGYIAIIGSMMGLGILIRLLKLPVDIHGLIDVAIGSALINGAMIYFRFALLAKKNA